MPWATFWHLKSVKLGHSLHVGNRMTLAVVLSFCAFLSTPFFSGTAPIWAQTAPQEASPQKPSDSSTQAGGDSSKTQTPSTATQAPSGQTKAAGKPATRKVKKSK